MESKSFSIFWLLRAIFELEFSDSVSELASKLLPRKLIGSSTISVARCSLSSYD